MKIENLCKIIDQRQDELFGTLCDLIGVNSENFSSHGNESNMAQFVNELCLKLGLESDVYSPLDIEGFDKHPDYMPGHNLENRYNVTATWRGENDTNELMLMGHLDTVEVGDLANWDFDPFKAFVKDGKIWGRGACDDKYAIATVLFLVKLLKEQGFKPKANLVFAGYCDEEHGGSHGALASVLKYPSKRIVNMDGRQGEIWHCASGGQETTFKYHSTKTVDSAKSVAEALPVVLDGISEFAENRRAELAANRFYKDTIIPDTSLRYMGIQCGNNGNDLGVGTLKMTYYTDKEKERVYGELEEISDKINNRLAPLGFEADGFTPNTRFFHYVFCEPDCEDITLMCEASLEAIGKEPVVCGSCLSDLSVIAKYGNSSAYAFGAGRDFSKEGGAHQPNEFIECDKLVEFAKVIGAFIIKVLG